MHMKKLLTPAVLCLGLILSACSSTGTVEEGTGSVEDRNAGAVPDIIRNGQPFRTLFPPGQEVERFPRVGWDRPKASDHCPVAISLDVT